MTFLDWRVGGCWGRISLAERPGDGELQRWDFFVGEEIGYPATSEARLSRGWIGDVGHGDEDPWVVEDEN